MKKLLLLGTAALACLASSAMEPKQWDNEQIIAISPNGTWGASTYYGNITLINNETGESTVLESSSTDYGLGAGNCVSNDGIMVGTYGNYPGYMKDGEWHNLNTPFPQNMNLAHGITPDGTRICGTIGTAKMSIEDTPVPMQSPCVWNLQADGTYSDPVMLPYPELDYTNRTPQYVTAISISDDGKTICGLVTDYQGFVPTLVYYTLNADNEWEMHNEFMRLANPDNVTIPEYPGDCPAVPKLEDFMTPEELQAFQDALDEWNASGDFDYEHYPKLEDFATEEEYNAWKAAKDSWQKDVYEPWSILTNEFYDAVESCNGTGMVFNNAYISSDGKTVISTAEVAYEDPDSWEGFTYHNKVAKFDLEGDSYVLLEGDDMNASSIADNGTVLASKRGGAPDQAYVYLPGDAENPVSLMEYVKEHDNAMYEWMQEKMVHDCSYMDMQTWEQVFIPDYEFTGVPFCSRSMNVISCLTGNFWDESADLFSFVIPMTGVVSVKDVNDAAGVNVMIFKGGVIVVEGEALALNVYDLNGRMVFSSGSTTGAVATGLSNGTYVVRVTTADGVQSRKAIF